MKSRKPERGAVQWVPLMPRAPVQRDPKHHLQHKEQGKFILLELLLGRELHMVL